MSETIKNTFKYLLTILIVGIVVYNTKNTNQKIKEYQDVIDQQNNEIDFLHERISRLSNDEQINDLNNRMDNVEIKLGLYNKNKKVVNK